MPLGGMNSLIYEALIQIDGFSRDRAEYRFSSVPHDCAEKIEIRRWQRPPIHGWIARICFRAVVGILNADDFEFSVRWNRLRDADETLGQKLAISHASAADSRDIGAGAVRPIIRSENRIHALRRGKLRLHVGGSNGPGRG